MSEPRDVTERPTPTAQWAYVGEPVEFDVDMAEGYIGFEIIRRYRYRRARLDDGSWDRLVVEHQTRNGWAHVGKKVAEGIAIGRALEALLPMDVRDNL
jgi:hypothetical protein